MVKGWVWFISSDDSCSLRWIGKPTFGLKKPGMQLNPWTTLASVATRPCALGMIMSTMSMSTMPKSTMPMSTMSMSAMSMCTMSIATLPCQCAVHIVRHLHL